MGKNTNFFLLKISQKQLLLGYFEYIFCEQLGAAILYTVDDGWQEPGCGRGAGTLRAAALRTDARGWAAGRPRLEAMRAGEVTRGQEGPPF